MTALARLTGAELRKLATTPAFLIILALAVVVDVLSAVIDAAVEAVALVIAGLTFGLGLTTIVIGLSAYNFHRLPPARPGCSPSR